MSDNPQKEYRIVIEEAIFKCCAMDVGSGIISAHSKTLQEGRMAQYFFNQSQINNFTISQGQRNFSETVFQGKMPHKIVVAFVCSQRYKRNYSLNPFKFNQYNVNTMSVLISDVCMPHRPLEMNFQKGQHYAMYSENIQMSSLMPTHLTMDMLCPILESASF